MDDTKPCKCGNSDIQDEQIHWEIDGTHWRIFCNQCGATTYCHSSYGYCLEEWNSGDLPYDGT